MITVWLFLLLNVQGFFKRYYRHQYPDFLNGDILDGVKNTIIVTNYMKGYVRESNTMQLGENVFWTGGDNRFTEAHKLDEEFLKQNDANFFAKPIENIKPINSSFCLDGGKLVTPSFPCKEKLVCTIKLSSKTGAYWNWKISYLSIENEDFKEQWSLVEKDKNIFYFLSFSKNTSRSITLNRIKWCTFKQFIYDCYWLGLKYQCGKKIEGVMDLHLNNGIVDGILGYVDKNEF